MQQYYPPMKNRITRQWPRVLLEPSTLTVWLEDGRSRRFAVTPDEYHGWFVDFAGMSMDGGERRDHLLDDLVEWVKAGGAS
jgi:hypothetical protein